MVETYTWPSPAKLNLFLSVTKKFHNGFHFLKTLIQFLNFYDTLTITNRYDGRIVLYPKNIYTKKKYYLIIRSAKLLQNYFWKSTNKNRMGANIHIKKKIPIGSGMGGGSSNAATTLVALNAHWNCQLSLLELLKLGIKIGSDVPFFINGNAAIVEGFGEQLNKVNLIEKWYFIAIPPIEISTRLAFNDPFLKIGSLNKSSIFISEPINDFELVIKKRFFFIEKYFSWLLKYAPSRLTGTGSCIFSEFDSKKEAYQVMLRKPTWMNGFIANSVNVSPLKNALKDFYNFNSLYN